MKISPLGIDCPHCGKHIAADPELVGAKATHQRQREAQYKFIGKRCSNCHAYQPVTAYNKSVNCTDGMQAVCRSCAALNLDLRAKGGLTLVRLTRAALQAKNDAVNALAGRK